jgi:hypothetical protein
VAQRARQGPEERHAEQGGWDVFLIKATLTLFFVFYAALLVGMAIHP